MSATTTPRGIARHAALDELRRRRKVAALAAEPGAHAADAGDEIAGVLGISESNAGTRLHRAVQRLREACHAPS